MSTTFKFKSQQQEYTVDPGDQFMDNGACIQFIPIEIMKVPMKNYRRVNPIVSNSEWARIRKEYGTKFLIRDEPGRSILAIPRYYTYDPDHKIRDARTVYEAWNANVQGFMNQGSFATALFNTYRLASSNNKEILGKAYPEYFVEKKVRE